MHPHKNESAFSFLIESSPTPIYRRITAGYKNSLQKKGHQVFYFDPSTYKNFEDAINALVKIISSQEINYFLIFDNSPLSNFWIEEFNCLVFEIFRGNVIFIHHDNLFTQFINSNSNIDFHLLEAWRRVKSRSMHFVLEDSNSLDLKLMGFENVFTIPHASEFKKKSSPDCHTHDLSFVGHVLPHFNQIFDQINHLTNSHQIAADFWSRLAHLDRKIENSAINYAIRKNSDSSTLNFFGDKFFYQNSLHLFSCSFRGELIKRLNPKFRVDVFGGSPSYLNQSSANQIIDNKNVFSHPPTATNDNTAHVYSTSRINLNITALQFDSAVVNRVIDIGMAGGFVLTDYRSNLAKITTVSKEISYKTIDELNEKVDYYLTHEKERIELTQHFHQEIAANYTYDHVVDSLLTRIKLMLTAQVDPVCVDLGCGISKPQGFIGVDLNEQENVDIVADLNDRFPFPDDTVDVVRAHDIIEHLGDRIHTMNEIWRICKPNAQIDIRVPSTDGRGAFQDPTHISFWNINSFKYYCVEFEAYHDLCKRYGFQGAFSIIQLTHEEDVADQVIHVRAILQAIKNASPSLDEFDGITLKKVNLIIFPDWLKLEAGLYQVLINVLKTLANHPDSQHISLLICRGNFPEDSEVELSHILYEIAFNMLLEENFDIADTGIDISIVEPLEPKDGDLLFQQILYKICLPFEYLDIINQPYIKQIQDCTLEALAEKRFLEEI